MKAMLLAAGRGERMRPLTDTLPKPLLSVGGKTLIEHQLERLSAAGVHEVFINHAWLGHKIVAHLGDGSAYDMKIKYLEEPEGALETAGAIINALPQLGDSPFIVTNADIWTRFDFTGLLDFLPQPQSAHLVLVDNPAHHPEGDFCLSENMLIDDCDARLTFSGIGIYHPEFFSGYSPGRQPLAPLLKSAIHEGRVTGQHYSGEWFDIGTPQRLQELEAVIG